MREVAAALAVPVEGVLLRRSMKIMAVSAATLLALTGCAKGNKSGDSSSQAVALNCKNGGSGPKVGLAYDVGGRGDHSFNDAAALGMQKAVDQLGATCAEAEAQDQEPESAREDRLRTLAEGGYNPVIAVGFAYSDAVNAVAPDFPKVNFAVVDGFDPDQKPNNNVAYLDFAENEGSFLVGVAAALKTKTNHIGFVGGVHIDLIKKFEAGYVAGAKAVKPNIKVDVKYIEESALSGFADPAGGKQAAAGMYDNGADIVYQAAGGSGSGVFDAAVDAGTGKWAIGVDSDQYLTASAPQKPHILTSMLKRVDTATLDMVKSMADGKPLVGYQTYNLAKNGVGYSTSGGFIDDITGQIDSYAAKIKSGQIKVPTTP